MKNKQSKEDIIDWCCYCKDAIYFKDGYVVSKTGKYYHLDCFLQLNGIEFDEEELYSIDNTEDIVTETEKEEEQS